ncbi:hypothetical protein F53441_7549 [Fusarium austroafricanum]|uniref:Extracellular membrane protein CFEM domain-containing protein n=1 Tax=Fusarium austroafricanum TaxID=2364996 RepID=A0A8H4KGD7_9HYPO|nr:hypothetical protein F53441_7549 [Fusarium austroafricanum]
MKLTSWAICSLALVAGAFGVDRPELFKSLPGCTSSCLDSYSNSAFDPLDICNDKKVKQELDDCFAHDCSDFERFEIAKIHANACDNKPKNNRFNHYVLLVAEVPAWVSPWLRVYSSWVTYESLSLDDYLTVICGLLYTVFATLVHFAHSVTGDTVVWNAVPEYITDGLKIGDSSCVPSCIILWPTYYGHSRNLLNNDSLVYCTSLVESIPMLASSVRLGRLGSR